MCLSHPKGFPYIPKLNMTHWAYAVHRLCAGELPSSFSPRVDYMNFGVASAGLMVPLSFNALPSAHTVLDDLLKLRAGCFYHTRKKLAARGFHLCTGVKAETFIPKGLQFS